MGGEINHTYLKVKRPQEVKGQDLLEKEVWMRGGQLTGLLLVPQPETNICRLRPPRTPLHLSKGETQNSKT